MVVSGGVRSERRGAACGLRPAGLHHHARGADRRAAFGVGKARFSDAPARYRRCIRTGTDRLEARVLCRRDAGVCARREGDRTAGPNREREEPYARGDRRDRRGSAHHTNEPRPRALPRWWSNRAWIVRNRKLIRSRGRKRCALDSRFTHAHWRYRSGSAQHAHERDYGRDDSSIGHRAGRYDDANRLVGREVVVEVARHRDAFVQ